MVMSATPPCPAQRRYLGAIINTTLWLLGTISGPGRKSGAPGEGRNIEVFAITLLAPWNGTPPAHSPQGPEQMLCDSLTIGQKDAPQARLHHPMACLLSAAGEAPTPCTLPALPSRTPSAPLHSHSNLEDQPRLESAKRLEPREGDSPPNPQPICVSSESMFWKRYRASMKIFCVIAYLPRVTFSAP
ncbi:hypothetical protein CB1_000349015 [Camelus ferus]|nr:hypothetical protein CB1_000349015 [Camelus ferus]